MRTQTKYQPRLSAATIRRSGVVGIAWVLLAHACASAQTLSAPSAPVLNASAPTRVAPPTPVTAAPDSTTQSPSVVTTVLDVGDGAAAGFSVSGDRLRRRLQLNIGSKPVAGKATVSISSFDLVDGDVSRQPSLEAGKGVAVREFGSGQPVVVDLIINDLPASGDYVGELKLLAFGDQGEIKLTKPIRITRSAPTDIPVSIGAVQRRMNSDILPTSSDQYFTIRVLNLSDRQIEVTPALYELVRTGTNASKTDAVFASSTITASPSSLTVPGGKTAETVLKVVGLGPGEYGGKLTFSSNAFKTKTESFNVSVRSSMLLAMGMFFIGAGASLWLRRISTRVRPRLVVRTAVSKLLWQIEALREQFQLDATELRVLNSIRARVGAIHQESMESKDPSSDWAAAAGSSLAADAQKLAAFPAWANARRLLASVSGLDDSSRQDFKARLAQAEDALVSADAMPAGFVQGQLKLTREIEDATGTVAIQAVKQAGVSVNNATEAASSEKAKKELQSAGDSVQNAVVLLQQRDYAGFRRAYENAGLAYYRGLAHQVEADFFPAPQASNDAVLTNSAPLARVPTGEALEYLRRIHDAPTLQSARDEFAMVRPTLARLGAGDNVELSGVSAPMPVPADIPDSGIEAQGSTVLPVATTFIEDPQALMAETRRLDFAIDVAAVATSALLGVMLVWMPNPGWGQPSDLIAALLWGMGLYTVGTSTFQGILSVRSSLTG